MAKQEQVLVIDPPNELAFTGPFTVSVSSYMKLTNPSDRKVCFKIKTTAPKRYCVKPNSGLIEQGQTVQILVSLQPFEFDPSEKNRHKFMVQAMYAPEGDFNQETLWKESDSSQLMDSKLKCVFVLPDGGDGGGGVIGGSSNNRDSDNGSTVSFKNIPPSPKNVGENDLNLKRTVEEIKKLQEEVSSLRQENIQLKEEALRQKRLAATSRSSGDDALSSPSSASGDKSSFAASSTVVTAANPNATALSNVYLYAALAILIFGVIVGKWIL